MGMRARIHRDRNLPVTWRDRGIRSLVQRRYILESHGGGVGPVTGQTRPARDRCRDSVVTESTRAALDPKASACGRAGPAETEEAGCRGLD